MSTIVGMNVVYLWAIPENHIPGIRVHPECTPIIGLLRDMSLVFLMGTNRRHRVRIVSI